MKQLVEFLIPKQPECKLCSDAPTFSIKCSSNLLNANIDK